MNNVPYADIVNQQFNKSQSHYVDIATRLRESIQENWKQQVLADAIATFKSVNKGLKRWEDLIFCRSLTSKLSMIDIDVTLQRLVGDHIIRKADGGGDGPDNIMTLCRTCDSKKTNMKKDYVRSSLLLEE